MSADFAYDHVVRYAVAYAARCTSTLGCVLLGEPRAFRREAIAIEAHSVEGVHMRTVRDVRRPYLRSPKKVETTDAGRFGGLLECCRSGRVVFVRTEAGPVTC
jgi:hypothetical protein